jgi:hypothetical protein
MRRLFIATLFAASCALAVNVDAPGQEKKQPPRKKAKVDPKTFRPDAATLKQIKEKTEVLRKAVAALREKEIDGRKIADDVLVEVEIYLKAAENIVRFEEWLHANSVRWAQQTLDQGLERAKQAEGGKAVWRDAPGKWVVRAYRSHIDDSIQPYAVLLPHDYGKDPNKKWRLDIVLHGRDSSLTEAKFIATHGTTAKEAPKDLGYVQLEPYGRGNNAYRWAGERDVFESRSAFIRPMVEEAGMPKDELRIDHRRLVLRGFSMGGAGTWHIGLHRPEWFCVLGPGAGFTTTHGYVPSLPEKLPDYQEQCLRIYDSYLYAENAFNVPIVAYSGEKDAQKKAADNIQALIRNFKEPVKFTHLIAPGLEHQFPQEWQAKAETEYRKYADKGRMDFPERVRFVTYTPKYGRCHWVEIEQLEKMYERAVVDAVRKGNTATVTTSNVRRVSLFFLFQEPGPVSRVLIDGQAIDLGKDNFDVVFEKRDKWVRVTYAEIGERLRTHPEKVGGLCGPIDDAFTTGFLVCGPTAEPWHANTGKYAEAEQARFRALWDRYFRGSLQTTTAETYAPRDNFKRDSTANLVLFGDPHSNPLIARVMPKLPIIWTKEKLEVNGVTYDPKTYVPVLIYPISPGDDHNYVVLNSGHTFKEADLKGTNALLFPRLGDWAVIKPTPTREDPAAYEVVAAGLFDENWQFPKK